MFIELVLGALGFSFISIVGSFRVFLYINCLELLGFIVGRFVVFCWCCFIVGRFVFFCWYFLLLGDLRGFVERFKINIHFSSGL